MKIRNGFVSNSSSSSFIIMEKENKTFPCPHCNKPIENKSISVRDMIHLNDNGETGIDIEGADAVITELNDWADHSVLYIKKIEENIKEFPLVYLCGIDYNDSMLGNLIKEEEKAGNILIVYSESE